MPVKSSSARRFPRADTAQTENHAQENEVANDSFQVAVWGCQR